MREYVLVVTTVKNVKIKPPQYIIYIFDICITNITRHSHFKIFAYAK